MIEIRDLTFCYDSSPVLDGITTTIHDGEWVLLVGKNGSGKTTLLKHCNALLTPTRGTVVVDGTSTTDDPVAARTAVGMVFQSPRDQFVAATVEADLAFGPENLGLPHEEIESRIDASLDAVDLHDKRTARIDSLSTGEQARVAIAGALAMRPSHLVLDEPFAYLDWPTRRSLLGYVRSLHAAGTSIVMATHSVDRVLDPADRILGLSAGTLRIDSDPHAVGSELRDIGVRPPTC